MSRPPLITLATFSSASKNAQTIASQTPRPEVRLHQHTHMRGPYAKLPNTNTLQTTEYRMRQNSLSGHKNMESENRPWDRRFSE